MIPGLAARLVTAVDEAVLWRLGLISVSSEQVGAPPLCDPASFWRATRVAEPVALVAHPLPPRRDGVRRVVLAGPSTGPGGHLGSRRLRARVSLHPDPGAPLVLLLHGYAAPAPYYEDHHARLLLRRGVSAARLDLPFHLHRRVPGRAHGFGFFGVQPEHTCAVLRQATEDAAAVVAWARREATPTAGALGFSLGGLVACLLAANVPLDAMAAVTPPADLPEIVLERAPRRLRRDLGVLDGGGGPWGTDVAAARAALAAAMAPITPRMLALRTPAERVTLVAAAYDRIVGARPVTELAAAWGTECWTYPHGHVTVMTARGITRRIHDRLAHHLGVTAARLAAAG